MRPRSPGTAIPGRTPFAMALPDTALSGGMSCRTVFPGLAFPGSGYPGTSCPGPGSAGPAFPGPGHLGAAFLGPVFPGPAAPPARGTATCSPAPGTDPAAARTPRRGAGPHRDTEGGT